MIALQRLIQLGDLLVDVVNLSVLGRNLFLNLRLKACNLADGVAFLVLQLSDLLVKLTSCHSSFGF